MRNENTRIKMTTLGCFFFSNRMKMNTRIKMRTLGPVVSFFSNTEMYDKGGK